MGIGVCMYVYVYSHVGVYVYTITCEGNRWAVGVFLDYEQLGSGVALHEEDIVI